MSLQKRSRRDFLKLSAITLGAITTQGFRPFFGFETEQKSNLMARVGTDSVSVYSQPNDESTILYQRYRDEIINVYGEVISEFGPGYNPLWYRVWGGYIHSGYLQRVEIDNFTEMQETMMVGLRLVSEGISIQNFSERFSASPMEIFAKEIDELEKNHLLEIVDGDIIRLTKNARLLGNQVFLYFVN